MVYICSRIDILAMLYFTFVCHECNSAEAQNSAQTILKSTPESMGVTQTMHAISTNKAFFAPYHYHPAALCD